jgi:diguanylate cyclase (GGDEF)-like protein
VSEHLQRLSALLPLVAGVRTSGDLDAVLPAVAEAAYEASGAACVTIFLRSLRTGRIEPVASHGPDQLRRALAAARPPADAAELTVVEGGGTARTVWVALTDTDDTRLGYLAASCHTDPQLSILAGVAAYGAQALRRARASIAAARHRAALEALMRLRAEYDERLGIDTLLRSVIDAAHAALGYRTVAIALAGPDGAGLVTRCSLGASPLPRVLSGAQLDGLLEDAATIEGAHLIRRGAFAALGGDPAGGDQDDMIALLPFGAGGRRLGALVAGEPQDTAWSDGETLAVLRLFAASAANRLLGMEVHATAERLAVTDALTGLGNRGAFVRETERLLRGHADVAILLCDMDSLKELNDREGHAAGDERLRLTARVLASRLAGRERGFRLGGDEFAVVVPAGGAARAGDLARAIDAALRAAGASASIGWAAANGQATVDELLDRADARMYRVKRGRRARVAQT